MRLVSAVPWRKHRRSRKSPRSAVSSGTAALPTRASTPRTFVVDARTGAVQSLFSSRPWAEEPSRPLSRNRPSRRAEAFLAEFCGGSRPTIWSSTSQERPGGRHKLSYSFQFARQEKWILLPGTLLLLPRDRPRGGRLSVRPVLPSYEGSHLPASLRISARWRGGPGHLGGTYPVTLGYLLVPQSLDPSDPAALRLSQMGWTSYYPCAWAAYRMDQEGGLSGCPCRDRQRLITASTTPVRATPSPMTIWRATGPASIERLP